MLPYVPYRFDISTVIQCGSNNIKVDLKDITASYGPTEGWEGYGGIIRDAYIEIVDNTYIQDYQWITEFDDSYKRGNCTLNIWIYNCNGSTVNRDISVNLSFGGNVVYSGTKKVMLNDNANMPQFKFSIDNPLLWSPDIPNLYELNIKITHETEVVDSTGQKVGFREFKVNGTRFYLNGKDIFLKGVGRHDMWGDSDGFTLTQEQMEQDMRLIKQMGANYICLVHYPHHKAIIEIADEIGLIVSDEPGLWQDDLNDEKVTSSALEVMRRTIIRDRNNASVLFWLLFNECAFAGDYLSRGKKLCLVLDPTRPVSAANNNNALWTKEEFSKADMDFYTYWSTIIKVVCAADVLGTSC